MLAAVAQRPPASSLRRCALGKKKLVQWARAGDRKTAFGVRVEVVTNNASEDETRCDGEQQTDSCSDRGV